MTRLRKGEDLTPYGIQMRMGNDMEMQAALEGAYGLLASVSEKFSADPDEEWRARLLGEPMRVIEKVLACCPTHSLVRRMVDERMLEEFVAWHEMRKEHRLRENDEKSV